ncbi:MAG: helix-turn-helix domain-containing protein [Porphyromonas sp.]|uniref:helix-turn-helix domain-containing protein n=1 Tax=Porphyromonas sp. TaxID=1924944 RepID=UPI002A7FD139|nr:helix-turn-helix domain-containing protein [Porphyromonas sp.]MDY4245766.1 helix-turn-helix domain-containing protein [Porphyromonas sp.]
MSQPEWPVKYSERQQATSQQAIERATDIILRATGKPRSYYTTRSRKVEFVAYRALFAYLAVELGASYTAVGKALNRSHATAIHAYDTYTIYATTWEPLATLRNKVINLSNTKRNAKHRRNTTARTR